MDTLGNGTKPTGSGKWNFASRFQGTSSLEEIHFLLKCTHKSFGGFIAGHWTLCRSPALSRSPKFAENRWERLARLINYALWSLQLDQSVSPVSRART
jgi:hypothetical protein